MKTTKHIYSVMGMLVLLTVSACKKNKNEAPEIDRGPAPQAVWKEKWLGHTQTLTLGDYNKDIAIYKDDTMSPDVVWPIGVMSKAWQYATKTYGKMGEDPRLYVVLHGGVHGSGGSLLPYFDVEGDYKNLVDVSTENWSETALLPEAMLLHEMGHVVEMATNGVKGSPAYPVWGDSKWMDLFIYDVYLGIGMQDKADSWYQKAMYDRVNFPREYTYWFRDWWMPIYTKHGGAKVLNSFFVLLSKHFPREPHIKGFVFSRGMNMGEFVHFWSGAAGENLKPLATKAFGWTAQTDAEYNQALIDFPQVKY